MGVKRFIDDRLKFIQQEDQGVVKKAIDKKVEEETLKERMAEDTLVPELDEKVVIPYSFKKQEAEAQAPAQKVETKPVTPSYNKVLKVCVGKYSTVEQARVAQSILQDSEVGVSSFIKLINGSYTLQVGSFTERAKAEQLLNELVRNSFPARIIQE